MTLLALLGCAAPDPPDPCVEPGIICTVAGTGAPGLSEDGHPLKESAIYWPSAVREHPEGLLAVCDSNSHRIRLMQPDDTFRSIVGSGVHAFSIVDQPATDTPLDFPVDFQFLPTGEILVAILHENAVRIVGPDGMIRAFAGSTIYGYATESTESSSPARSCRSSCGRNVTMEFLS